MRQRFIFQDIQENFLTSFYKSLLRGKWTTRDILVADDSKSLWTAPSYVDDIILSDVNADLVLSFPFDRELTVPIQCKFLTMRMLFNITQEAFKKFYDVDQNLNNLLLNPIEKYLYSKYKGWGPLDANPYGDVRINELIIKGFVYDDISRTIVPMVKL